MNEIGEEATNIIEIFGTIVVIIPEVTGAEKDNLVFFMF